MISVQLFTNTNSKRRGFHYHTPTTFHTQKRLRFTNPIVVRSNFPRRQLIYHFPLPEFHHRDLLFLHLQRLKTTATIQQIFSPITTCQTHSHCRFSNIYNCLPMRQTRGECPHVYQMPRWLSTWRGHGRSLAVRFIRDPPGRRPLVRPTDKDPQATKMQAVSSRPLVLQPQRPQRQAASHMHR